MKHTADTGVLEVTWGNIQINTRVANILKREGIHTLGQLQTYCFCELLDLRNMGVTLAKAVGKVMFSNELSMKDCGAEPGAQHTCYTTIFMPPTRKEEKT